MTIDPQEVPMARMHALLLGSVIPRPIAFASTVDKDGNVNLSPFSYFNCFGANPPVLIFSPARRGRDNTTKHTYENILEVPEVVIHIVNYSIVQQMSLASTEYPRGVNEFVKAGFTAIPSLKVKPPRVKEAPVAFECKVIQVTPTGEKGGAGNLVICHVMMMHVHEDVVDASGRIDPFKLDAVARLGGDFYCRVHGDAIFKIPKPLEKIGIGMDQLPPHIRSSKVLSGNDLGLLAGVEELPQPTRFNDDAERLAFQEAQALGQDAIHRLAHHYIERGKTEQAWNVLLSGKIN
ncbi:MAG TPA: flavin reductase family protein [Chryseolinea sp.]|nr:flavin reductase family protein [Chryseolinea sp.]